MTELITHPPAVSVVSAVYNVAEYLPDFFESLRNQTFDHERIEVVLVDDGSTDGSWAMCQKFVEGWPGPATVITQPNGGQASARNRGLAAATGTWLSLLDPDDMVAPNYFERLVEFATRPENSDVVVHASVLVIFNEATGDRKPTHQLNFRFAEEDRVVDLDTHASHAQWSAASALIRREAVEGSGIRFDPRIRPNFEDAAFLARLLLDQPIPQIGFVASASYIYRKRAARTSTLDLARTDPRRYTDVLRYGLLGVLDRAHQVADERGEDLPRWVQNVVLYDLLWIFKDSQTKEFMAIEFSDALYEEFAELLDQILVRVTNDAIAGFDVMHTPWWCLPALLLRKLELTHTDAWRGADDPGRGLSSLRYLHAGSVPVERLSVDGRDVVPHFTRELECVVLNRPFVWEREVWIPRGEQRLWIDGDPQAIYEWPQPVMHRFQWFHPYLPDSERPETLPSLEPAEVPPDAPRPGFRERRARRRYADAWVVMDRDTAANDCGEVFYKWLRANHPEIDSYFVVRDDVPDWKRLRAEGIKPVAHGSRQWKELMLNARHLISSQIDEYVVNPLPAKDYGQPKWAFTFLQHGVIKDNMFNWFNHKKIDVFVTSTQAEYDYCAGPGPSSFGNREVRLTGLARFDDLLEIDNQIGPEERTYILIAPTWRFYLMGAVAKGNERELNAEFMQTAYARAWSDLLHSRRLQTIAEAAEATVAFMPHPNIQPYLDRFDLPSWVTVLRHQDVNVRETVARSRMMITDYSSIAFDMAYLRRHVVYYQFDRSEFFAGGHVFTPGYFNYVDDGFGPVAEDLGGVLTGVNEVLTGTVDPRYAARIASAFPVRDGRNCERTFDAIIASQTPLTFEEAAVAAPFDSWSNLT